jgi:knotted carbamoyltransferase YgeW
VETEGGIRKRIEELGGERPEDLYLKDFLCTWDKDKKNLEAIMKIASILKAMRERNISTRVFDSGLAVSQFRDKSTRTRFSFSSAADLLGLSVVDLEEGKSQISHGETVRETAVMVSFMAEAIGIRDDMFIGKGHAYMAEVADAVERGYRDGVLAQRPAVVNLQSDIDHPTQSMSDLMHAAEHFGGLGALKGRKLAMSWAYSPSYGKPLSVPQGVIALFSRFGMDVVLAHPEGYSLLPDVVERTKKLAGESGGSFKVVASMEEAFENAHVVYPKSWAPFSVMEERARLVEKGDSKALDDLEKRCLAQNARYKDWECSSSLMAKTRDALYLHCLPADISGVSCPQGEVSSEVFDRFRTSLYRQAGFKPYVIAAMILASRTADPAVQLSRMLEDAAERVW